MLIKYNMLGETEKSSDVCRTASLSEMGHEQRATTSSTVTAQIRKNMSDGDTIALLQHGLWIINKVVYNYGRNEAWSISFSFQSDTWSKDEISSPD